MLVTEERLDGVHRLNHPRVLDDKVAARCDEAVVGRQVLGDGPFLVVGVLDHEDLGRLGGERLGDRDALS